MKTTLSSFGLELVFDREKDEKEEQEKKMNELKKVEEFREERERARKAYVALICLHRSRFFRRQGTQSVRRERDVRRSSETSFPSKSRSVNQ